MYLQSVEESQEHSQTGSSTPVEPEKQIVDVGLRSAPGGAGWARAQPHRTQGLPSHENSKQCWLHGNYTAKGQAEWMVEADRPRDPRAISLGFDSWLVRALTKYSIFIFTLHSLPLTGLVIENSGMKVRGHLSAGPSILPAQTSSSWKQGQRTKISKHMARE